MRHCFNSYQSKFLHINLQKHIQLQIIIKEIHSQSPAMRTDAKIFPKQQKYKNGFRSTKSYTGIAKQEGMSKNLLAYMSRSKEKEDQKSKTKKVRCDTEPRYQQKRVFKIKSQKFSFSHPHQQLHTNQNRVKTQECTLNATKKTPKSANTKTTQTKPVTKTHQTFFAINQKKLSQKLTKIGDQQSKIKKGERRKQKQKNKIKTKNRIVLKNVKKQEIRKGQTYMKSMLIFSNKQLVSSFVDETQFPTYSSRYEIYQDRIHGLKKEEAQLKNFLNSIDMRMIKEIKRAEVSYYQQSCQISIIKDLIERGRLKTQLENASRVIQRFWRKVCKKGIFKQYYTIFSSVCQSFQLHKQKLKQSKSHDDDDYYFDEAQKNTVIRLIKVPVDQESESINSQQMTSNQSGFQTKFHSFYGISKVDQEYLQKQEKQQFTAFEQYIGDQSISKLFQKNTMGALTNTNNNNRICTYYFNALTENEGENDQLDELTNLILGALVKQASQEVKKMMKTQINQVNRFEDQPRKVSRVFNPDSLFLYSSQDKLPVKQTLNTGINISSFHLFTQVLLQILEKSSSLLHLVLNRLSKPIGLDSVSFLKQFHQNQKFETSSYASSQSSDFLDKIILPYSLYEEIAKNIFEKNVFTQDFQQLQEIWFGCIFDCINQRLDEHRPFGASIPCYPWTSRIKVPRIVKQRELIPILRQSIEQLHKNAVLPIGIIEGKKISKCLGPLNEETQQLLNQMRMFEYLANQLESNERFWEQIDDLKMTVLTEVWQSIQQQIYEEAIQQIVQLYQLYCQNPKKS